MTDYTILWFAWDIFHDKVVHIFKQRKYKGGVFADWEEGENLSCINQNIILFPLTWKFSYSEFIFLLKHSNKIFFTIESFSFDTQDSNIKEFFITEVSLLFLNYGDIWFQSRVYSINLTWNFFNSHHFFVWS